MLINYLDVWENGIYNEIHFKLNHTVLLNEVILNNYSDEKSILQHITIFGIQNEPTNVQVNGALYNQFSYNNTEEVRIFIYYYSLIIDSAQNIKSTSLFQMLFGSKFTIKFYSFVGKIIASYIVIYWLINIISLFF